MTIDYSEINSLLESTGYSLPSNKALSTYYKRGIGFERIKYLQALFESYKIPQEDCLTLALKYRNARLNGQRPKWLRSLKPTSKYSYSIPFSNTKEVITKYYEQSRKSVLQNWKNAISIIDSYLSTSMNL